MTLYACDLYVPPAPGAVHAAGVDTQLLRFLAASRKVMRANDAHVLIARLT